MAVDPAAKELAGLVDSDRARVLLVDLLRRRAAEPRVDVRASAASDGDHARELPGSTAMPTRVPDQATLRGLALETSLDFAALTFAEAIGADERSRAVQAVFDRSFQDGPARSEELLRRPGAFPYTVLFAPSWMYRSHPGTGSDFARQRRLLDRLGIPHRSIVTAESGSVEANAAAIAAAVREATQRRETVIIVSASKSGAEVAFALARLLEPREAVSVAGWLNLAGALRGSPLADTALRAPASWVARSFFWLAGWDWAGMVSLGTERSRKRLEAAHMPDSIAVVNLIPVTMSGSVGSQVFFGYEILRDQGPNDGAVLLTDTVWPGGANLVALGADHLLMSGQNEGHGMALLRTMDFAIRRHGATASARHSGSQADRPTLDPSLGVGAHQAVVGNPASIP